MARYKYCEDCGQKVSESARTCETCGARIKISWKELGKNKKSLIVFAFLLLALALITLAVML